VDEKQKMEKDWINRMGELSDDYEMKLIELGNTKEKEKE